MLTTDVAQTEVSIYSDNIVKSTAIYIQHGFTQTFLSYDIIEDLQLQLYLPGYCNGRFLLHPLCRRDLRHPCRVCWWPRVEEPNEGLNTSLPSYLASAIFATAKTCDNCGNLRKRMR